MVIEGNMFDEQMLPEFTNRPVGATANPGSDLWKRR